MIKYFKQSLTNKKNYEVVANLESATHFQENDGNMTSISELTLNADETEEGALPMPVLDFAGNEKTKAKQTNSNKEDGLPMPVLNFDEEENEKVIQKNSDDEESPLPLPSL